MMIATMMSFAFNTMIGQITPIAMTNIGYKYYFLFVVSASYGPCLLYSLTFVTQIGNFTNALFFWAFLPETAKRPLEEMRYLFTEAPLFVPTMNMRDYETRDLEHRVEEVEAKQGYTSHVETHL